MAPCWTTVLTWSDEEIGSVWKQSSSFKSEIGLDWIGLDWIERCVGALSLQRLSELYRSLTIRNLKVWLGLQETRNAYRIFLGKIWKMKMCLGSVKQHSMKTFPPSLWFFQPCLLCPWPRYLLCRISYCWQIIVVSVASNTDAFLSISANRTPPNPLSSCFLLLMRHERTRSKQKKSTKTIRHQSFSTSLLLFPDRVFNFRSLWWMTLRGFTGERFFSYLNTEDDVPLQDHRASV